MRAKRRDFQLLLVEDNVVNQRLAIRVLEKFGYNVRLAENGLQAVAAVYQQKFDLILMDVQMPEMGGFEATTKIREFESKSRGKRTPIIAMTAHATQGYREKCLEGGMDGYISKPIRTDVLKNVLESFLGKEGPSQEEKQQQLPALPPVPPEMILADDGYNMKKRKRGDPGDSEE